MLRPTKTDDKPVEIAKSSNNFSANLGSHLGHFFKVKIKYQPCHDCRKTLDLNKVLTPITEAEAEFLLRLLESMQLFIRKRARIKT